MENFIIPILISILIVLFIILAFRRNKKPVGNADVVNIAVLEERIAGYQESKKQLEEQCSSFSNEILQLKRENANLEKQLAVSSSTLESERSKSEEKIRLIKEAKEELTNQFKVLANSILEEKSKIFKEQNSSNLGEILNPLKERLGEFQKTIQENYENEGKERHSLKREVESLMKMNDRLSSEAARLSNALKGESKTRGNWGEMILERILEVSGLHKDVEYSIQPSFSREDGSRLQPDVIINLPDNRYMVIDSKVSLNAYEQYVNNAENIEIQSDALKSHLASIRSHIKGLSSKEYHKIHQDNSPGFVIMFIPIEAAFMLAIAGDGKIWEEAWKSNILMVSPSTLLFVMRIVMQLWRQEQSSQNALEIARRGAALYDKLVGFVEEFDTIGTRIRQAGKSFDDARIKLTSGKGNTIRQAQMLKDLGITPGKQMPEEYTEHSGMLD